MKKKLFKILLLVFMVMTAFTTKVYADHEIELLTNPSTGGYKVVKAADHSQQAFNFSYLDTSYALNIYVTGNTINILTHYAYDPIGDNFDHWEYSKMDGTGPFEIPSEGLNITAGELKSLTAVFSLSTAHEITFQKNIDSLSYTATPSDITQIEKDTEVHFKATTGTSTDTQVDYYTVTGIDKSAITMNGAEMVFSMPNNNITIKAYGSTFINNVNITFDSLTEGATSIGTPTIDSGAKYTANVSSCSEVGGDPVSVSNPFTSGKQYVAQIQLSATTGYSFKYEGALDIQGDSTANQYAYNVNTKVNGNNVPKYSSAGSTVTGYQGATSQDHNTLLIYYYFTIGGGSGSGGGSSSGGDSGSSHHEIPNTGVE